jgi:hypothetical protein
MKYFYLIVLIFFQSSATCQTSDKKFSVPLVGKNGYSVNTLPTWSTPLGSLNVALECSDSESLLLAQSLFPTATNACDAAGFTLVKTSGPFMSGSCAGGGLYINSWVATDACGNTSAPFYQFITIQDTTAPSWLTLGGSLDVTVTNADTAGLAAAQALEPIAADNCANTTIIKTSGPMVPGEGICNNTGTYTNFWIALDDCGNIATAFQQLITVSCDPLQINTMQGNSVNLYPNPTKDKIVLQLNNNREVAKIIITDLTGKIVVQQTQNTTQIDVAHLARGIYIVEAYSGKDKWTSKFIKE